VSRKEFKDVFFAGKQIKLIDPFEGRDADDLEQQEDLLK
jgi:hypothetical protein